MSASITNERTHTKGTLSAMRGSKEAGTGDPVTIKTLIVMFIGTNRMIEVVVVAAMDHTRTLIPIEIQGNLTTEKIRTTDDSNRPRSSK